MKLYEKYLSTNNNLKEGLTLGSVKKSVKDIINTPNSDEKDEIATDLMNDIEELRILLNKKTKDTNNYNNRIKLNKEINKLISDMVDSKNPKSFVSKIESKLKEMMALGV